MLSREAWELRKAEDELQDRLRGSDRFVDMGVVLRVVVQDPAGEELVPGKPRLRVVREHVFGGRLDTRARPPRFVGPALHPRIWYCGEAQERVLLCYRQPKPSRHLVYGAMGGGKTVLLAMWTWLQVIALTGTSLQIGLTAPTEKRATILRDAIVRRAPAHWFSGGSVSSGWSERRGQFRFANGIVASVVSTHVSSEAEGSRLQGHSWAVCGSDEIQDSLGSDSEIESRGRSAQFGYYHRLATCTPKMSPDWRTYSDARRSTPDVWSLHHITGFENPFTWPEYLEQQRQTLDPREYQRRVLGRDLPPARAVYHTWSRDENLRPVPVIGARDVTREVLRDYGPNYEVLIGHDPGNHYNVSVLLKAYRIHGEALHSWWVVGEVTSESSTTEGHLVDLGRALAEWGYPGVALVRADPYTDTGTERKPDKTVYTQFKNAGFDIRPAAYSASKTSVGPGVIHKDARIEMMVGLLCSASGRRRLFIACDDHRRAAAPRLVAALESEERDEAYKAETARKRKGEDMSHWPAATGYALWALERPRMGKVA